MDIIVLTKLHKKPQSIRITDTKWIIRLFSVFALVAILLASAGYYVAGHAMITEKQQASVMLKRDINERNIEVKNAVQDAHDNLNALALRLGQIEAHIVRLNALGERVADLANIDKSEFDFSILPAQGGRTRNEDVVAYSVPDFIQALSNLSAKIESQEYQLSLLDNYLTSTKLSSQTNPQGSSVADGWLSSPYGYRTDPFTGKKSKHYGVDIAGKYGSVVQVAAAGIVTWSGAKPGYGNMIEVSHGDGFVTRYAHNEKNIVQVGEAVKKGQKIALMGSSGRSTGPHVHFEVLRNGKDVNPSWYMSKK